MPKIQINDVWRDLDPRRARTVIVREIGPDFIHVQTATGGPIVRVDPKRFKDAATSKKGFVLFLRPELAQEVSAA